MNFDLTVVTDKLKFPEGPVAMADGSVLLVEIGRKTLTRVTPDGTIIIVAELGGGPNGAAIGPDGAAYVCNNGGTFSFVEHEDGGHSLAPMTSDYKGGLIQRVDLKTGAVSTLYDRCDGRKLAGPNDLVFDRTGGFWFTDHGYSTPEHRVLGGLFYARPDGSKIVRLRDRQISPNGVGLSPDEKTVYFADTILQRLWAIELAAPGEPARPDGDRVVCNLPGLQPLDSLAVEAGGKVCVATIGVGGGVTAFDPVDGATELFPVPDRITTNVCFGGADMRDAWITASDAGRLYRGRWPRPGLKLNFNA
jgi:gluconolactonase